MNKEIKLIICGALAFFIPTSIGFAYQFFVKNCVDDRVIPENYNLVDCQITPDENVVLIQDEEGKTYKVSVDNDTYTEILSNAKER